jgi:hypothetical protein
LIDGYGYLPSNRSCANGKHCARSYCVYGAISVSGLIATARYAANPAFIRSSPSLPVLRITVRAEEPKILRAIVVSVARLMVEDQWQALSVPDECFGMKFALLVVTAVKDPATGAPSPEVASDRCRVFGFGVEAENLLEGVLYFGHRL